MSEEKSEDIIIVRCERKKDSFGIEKYHCKYDGGEFEIEIGDRREEVEFFIPKSLSEKHDIKELVRMMLEPAKKEGD